MSKIPPLPKELFLPCQDFDLATTLRSGQVFRWREDSAGRFNGWFNSHPVSIRQEGAHLSVWGASPPEVKRFFSLDEDLSSIARAIDVDPIIHGALENHWGLRLIRQDAWECLATFVLSAFNNIPRLAGMIERLCVRWGLTPKGQTPLDFRFPGPRALAKAPERALRACGLGFRAPYLKAAAQAVASREADLERWRDLEDEVLRRALLGVPGVGEKVAECVMLFAYGRTSAFPVDVWIGRAMRSWYFPRRKVTDRQIREFARRHFGHHCGWAQQYLFCHAREAGVRISLERTDPSGASS